MPVVDTSATASDIITVHCGWVPDKLEHHMLAYKPFNEQGLILKLYCLEHGLALLRSMSPAHKTDVTHESQSIIRSASSMGTSAYRDRHRQHAPSDSRRRDKVLITMQGCAKLPHLTQFKLPHQPYNYLEQVCYSQGSTFPCCPGIVGVAQAIHDLCWHVSVAAWFQSYCSLQL